MYTKPIQHSEINDWLPPPQLAECEILDTESVEELYPEDEMDIYIRDLLERAGYLY